MSTAIKRRLVPTSTHWGTYFAEAEGDRLIAVHDYDEDPAPAIIGPGIVEAIDHQTRVRRPMVRKGWLVRKGLIPAGKRGQDSFVEIDWQTALDLVAGELNRVRTDYGNQAIFAGCYGWASAGRFHHA